MDAVKETVQQAWASLRAAKTAQQAEQLLRYLGGGPIVLRISTGLAEADARGLGMTASSFEEVVIGPAMLMTRSNGTRVVQLSATSVCKVAEVRSTTANELLASAIAVVVANELIPVAKVEPQYIGLVEYMYNLVLSE